MYFRELARQTSDLESFAAQALQLVGDIVGASIVTLSIRNTERNEQVINATLSRKYKEWRFTLDNPDMFYKHSRVQLRPVYRLCSSFLFNLDLPLKWSGMFLAEYPGIVILSSEQYKKVISILEDLSYNLHIVLLNQEMERVEYRLQEEELINKKLREVMTDLSKEIYCVSSISTVLGQSHDVVEILSRLFGITLPLLKAEFGAIYLPETDQSLFFQAAGSKYKRYVHNNYLTSPQSKTYDFNEYFEKKLSYFRTCAEGISFKNLPITDTSLPTSLKGHFEALGIRSAFEFSLRFRNEFFGLGLVGFLENNRQTNRLRLFMITLNITSLFMENISLVRDLERQMKLKSQEVLEMEKRQRFLFDNAGRSYPLSKSITSERILEEMERSRKTALLGELASGVAHQIRNPLNNLVAALHLIKNNHTTEKEKEELFERLTERVETMNRMISEFIHYTRIPELNLSSECMNKVLKNSIQTFKGWTDLAGVNLITSFDPELSLTKIDLYLMNQVFHNIIKNALEAMSNYENGCNNNNAQLRIFTRKLQIKHDPEPHLEFIEIMCQDSGQGIDEKDIGKVLNPFYSKKKDGIGLGLAIVDHVVRAHGGGVRIKSRPGEGTNVMVYLPIR